MGLVYIRNTCNAEQTKIYVENKLEEFEIDIQRDVISSTHDLGDFNITPEHVEEEAAANHIICEADNYYDVLKNVRKIIKMFKASSVKNNFLQGYEIDQEEKPLQLILDIKIRWNSLVSMLKRLIQLKEPLNKALHVLGQHKISENDLS